MTNLRSKRNTKLRANDTVLALQGGQLRFSRRLDVKMWHPNHLKQAIDVLTNMVDELTRLQSTKELRQVDKLIYAQSVLISANNNLASVTPKDPRTRGAERIEWKFGGLVDTNGYASLGSRGDLDNS
tara:strand:+ start:691 stop:1071 length:381 start_codon:yes stop_codon:yes gene_type:complete